MDTFTARTPVDLLAVVPYVIGFHPEDSVVMLTLADRTSTSGPGPGPGGFHARVDLPVTEHEQRGVVTLLRDVAVQHDAVLVGLLLYTEDVAAARLFCDLAVPAMTAAGIGIVDVIRADGDRFFAVEDRADPGTPYDLSTHEYTAAAVVAGRTTHESRTALQESLVGTDADDAEMVGAAASTTVDELLSTGESGASLTSELAGQAEWLADAISWYLDLDVEPGPADAGRMLVLVSFEALREVAWANMTRANAGRHVSLWRGLVRRAPAELQAGVGGLLGFSAWLAGDGALAWCALDRCFEADPDDQLGHYTAALVETATPPSVWAPVPRESLRIFQIDPDSETDPVGGRDVPLVSSHGPRRGPAGVQPS
ncbi:MAG: hypothetical protein JWQ74_3101 [Marmoricola sp.]|nr:hypothetical protein [Marmoricola sp.]